MDKMQNILIIKPSALGDVIQVTCMLPVIKQHNPGVKISWLIFEHNKDIVANHPLIDEILVWRRRGSSLRDLWDLIKKLRNRKFDAVIDVQGLLRSAVIAWLTGCKRRIGFKNAREMAPWFYTEKYDVPTRKMHAVDGYLKLCEALGMPKLNEINFPLPIQQHHQEKITALLGTQQKPVIIICPTARWQTKCWPASYFAALADKLKNKYHGTIIFIGAPNEQEKIKHVIDFMQEDAVDLTGKLNLMEVAALLEQSNLYIGNDSGLMHMAAATKTPLVAIFGPTDPKRTGPYSSNAKVVKADLSCMPCFARECKYNHECMRELSVEKVTQACNELI
jgi:lipopolysaccharide heptosyltransferase I